ncbi:MAG: hypothetical protein COU85_01285 [Candidatus Portnoybacteria bacterium CG10_big_fil_rev_8_21_14_0_10_44_7]|uniref:HypC/HybG/HupF family hydrogenase formation chaperone n=1 Tax=Candidatus Portnoybacteria bacterium CG10_big_fil_rev_8_21_14_0_10_44_7 TaxID=1974816 RepID=A0A2M8KJ07_9BACT|nr:MAG: hypothetical protein COU85_01285 [Candidatus Portnoybacteria bacterium CG10_big_fil_rev_8_21_14_0_10_44_7]
MCLIIPQKIEKTKNDIAFFKDGQTAVLNQKIIKVKTGDWVFVKNGHVINKLSDTEARQTLKLLKYAK